MLPPSARARAHARTAPAPTAAPAIRRGEAAAEYSDTEWADLFREPAAASGGGVHMATETAAVASASTGDGEAGPSSRKRFPSSAGGAVGGVAGGAARSGKAKATAAPWSGGGVKPPGAAFGGGRGSGANGGRNNFVRTNLRGGRGGARKFIGNPGGIAKKKQGGQLARFGGGRRQQHYAGAAQGAARRKRPAGAEEARAGASDDDGGGTGAGGGGGGGGSKGKCFKCGQVGHWAAKCTEVLTSTDLEAIATQQGATAEVLAERYTAEAVSGSPVKRSRY